MTGRLRLRGCHDGVEWRAIDGEIVVLDTKTSQYLAVNHSAAVLWALLVEGTTPAALAAVLSESYGVDSVAAREDVDAFLAVLRETDLLEPGP